MRWTFLGLNAPVIKHVAKIRDKRNTAEIFTIELLTVSVSLHTQPRGRVLSRTKKFFIFLWFLKGLYVSVLICRIAMLSGQRLRRFCTFSYEGLLKCLDSLSASFKVTVGYGLLLPQCPQLKTLFLMTRSKQIPESRLFQLKETYLSQTESE